MSIRYNYVCRIVSSETMNEVYTQMDDEHLLLNQIFSTLDKINSNPDQQGRFILLNQTTFNALDFVKLKSLKRKLRQVISDNENKRFIRFVEFIAENISKR